MNSNESFFQNAHALFDLLIARDQRRQQSHDVPERAGRDDE